MELQTREVEGKSLFSYNWVRTVVIGAILPLAAGLALGQDDKGHTVPPIIIKSIDEAGELIGIESATTLQESKATPGKLKLTRHIYTLKDFKTTKYVEIFWEIDDGGWKSQIHDDVNGLDLKIWLQRYKNNKW